MFGVKDDVDFFDMVGQTDWHCDIQRTLIHWMGVRDSDVVLDAGCGAGHFLMQLAQRVQRVTGLDHSVEMLRRAELNASDFQIANADFTLGSLSDLPFAAGFFDVCISLNTLFMFSSLNPLRECIRVTKSGGEIILVNPSTNMNPWSAQVYCETNRKRDFERDSFISYAMAAARYGTVNEQALERSASHMGAQVTETLRLLDGLILVSRLKKVSLM